MPKRIKTTEEERTKLLPKPSSEEQKEEKLSREIGGPLGLEPTRYGDWERRGRCSDF